jgi:phosphatidylglycerol:prolipoprotein diacylglycerol transferase
MPLALFTSPGPLVFQLGPFALRWYGLLIALAVLIGLMVSMRLARLRGIDPGLVADLLPLLVLGAVIGARSYYVALQWPEYQGHWGEMLAIWHGGIAIHGALIVGSLTTIAFCRWRRQPFWPLLDILLPAVALGQAIGRWGNFFNSEAFGAPSDDLPWRLTIPLERRPLQFLDQATYHPTFLYESLEPGGVRVVVAAAATLVEGSAALAARGPQLRLPAGLQQRPAVDRGPTPRSPLPVHQPAPLRRRPAHGPGDQCAADRRGECGLGLDLRPGPSPP